MNSQTYLVSGCALDDLDACMDEITNGMQIRFQLPVTVNWNVIEKVLKIELKSKSEEMASEEFVFDQLWDEILGAFEMAGDEISFKHVPST
ncbi:hypothetical protein [uncultured Paraglaciecola sp.]|uniref:hypothetical protein n=1 Tax=uncultured Paraglaciecola sp. TaxID=1765024 RepID=UPI0030DB1F49